MKVKSKKNMLMKQKVASHINSEIELKISSDIYKNILSRNIVSLDGYLLLLSPKEVREMQKDLEKNKEFYKEIDKKFGWIWNDRESFVNKSKFRDYLILLKGKDKDAQVISYMNIIKQIYLDKIARSDYSGKIILSISCNVGEKDGKFYDGAIRFYTIRTLADMIDDINVDNYTSEGVELLFIEK